MFFSLDENAFVKRKLRFIIQRVRVNIAIDHNFTCQSTCANTTFGPSKYYLFIRVLEVRGWYVTGDKQATENAPGHFRSVIQWRGRKQVY